MTATEVFSPARAAIALACGTNSRRLNLRRVAELAAAMRDGTFDPERGRPVFIRHGRLRGGQHRMAAIAMSGVSVRIPVTRR